MYCALIKESMFILHITWHYFWKKRNDKDIVYLLFCSKKRSRLGWKKREKNLARTLKIFYIHFERNYFMDTTLWDVYINRGLCFIHAHIHKSPDVFISLQRPAFLSSIFSKLLYLLYFIFFFVFCFFSLSVSFSRLFFHLFSLSLFHRDDGREKREGGLSQRNVLNSFRYYSPPGFLPFRRISYLIFEAHRKKKKIFLSQMFISPISHWRVVVVL